MKVEIAVITTMISGRLHFIKIGSMRSDGKYLAEYLIDPDEAEEFDDENQAASLIPMIHNPLDRDFGTGIVGVEREGVK